MVRRRASDSEGGSDLTAFDRAWNLVKEEDDKMSVEEYLRLVEEAGAPLGVKPGSLGPEVAERRKKALGNFYVPVREEDTRLKDALNAAREKKRTPLELPGYVRTGSKQDDKGDEE